MVSFPHHLLPPSVPRRRAALIAPAPQPCPDFVPDPTIPPGSICEVCFDAPAVLVCPIPDGEEMGVCEDCGTQGQGATPDL